MQRYYVNTRPQPISGDHEVHTTGCPHPPNEENRRSLGLHATCKGALVEARRIYGSSVDGCAYCCLDCHSH